MRSVDGAGRPVEAVSPRDSVFAVDCGLDFRRRDEREVAVERPLQCRGRCAVLQRLGNSPAVEPAGQEAADEAVFEQPTFEADTHDPVGSGDAFVGGFLARWLDGGTVPEALEYGAATAALKRTLDGDLALVSPAEVEAAIEGEDGISR